MKIKLYIVKLIEMDLILNSSIIISIFYLFYLLILKKDTFFHWNRAFILFSLAIAAIIPWLTLDLSWWQQKHVVFDFASVQQVVGAEQVTTVTPVEPAFNWMNLLLQLYLAGLVIFSLRFLLIVGQVIRIYVKGKKVRSGQHKLVLVDEMINPFSFFNHIYLPASFYQPGKNLEVILNHENVHQRQWHSADRLLMELFLVYQWFNPLAWLVRKEMILVHEYLADRNQSRVQNQFDYQQSLLKHLLARTTLSLGNNFSAHLKKRIKMMNRSMTPDWQKAKFILVAPLVALLLFTCTQQEMEVFNQMHHEATNETSVIKGRAVDVKTGEPLPGINIIMKGTTVGTVSDLEGEFSLKVPANRNELVAAFIGYNSIVTPLKKGYNHVTLKLTKDEYDEDWEVDFNIINPVESKVNRPDVPRLKDVLKGENEAGIDIRSTTGEGDPLFLIKEENGYRKIERDQLNTINPESVQSIEVLKSGAMLVMLQKKFDAEDTNGVILINLKE